MRDAKKVPEHLGVHTSPITDEADDAFRKEIVEFQMSRGLPAGRIHLPQNRIAFVWWVPGHPSNSIRHGIRQCLNFGSKYTMHQYVITLRRAAGAAFIDEVDLAAPKYLKVPEGETPAPKHRTKMSAWCNEVIGSFSKVDGQPTGNIVFFVHGYNNTVQAVTTRQRLLQTGLIRAGFQCLTISFDWPSDDKPIAYLSDLDHAKRTAVQLVNAGVKPFVKSLREDCNINVHVLGHSMGAFVIREAFDHADDGKTAETNWTANQLILFAGDAGAPKFSAANTETQSLYRHCYRLTNYFNGYDEILQISNMKRIGLSPRVGRVGLPADAPTKAVNVDCSAYFQSAYGARSGEEGYNILTHSWYFSDEGLFKDLALTLAGAIDREKIPTRVPGGGRTQLLSPPSV